MRHLDDLLYQQLLTVPGQVPAEVREHLQSECERCAGYLAQRASVDRLDGRVDEALLAASSARARELPAPSGELEAILARLESRPMSPRRFGLAAVAGLVAVGVVFAIARRPPPLPFEDGVKGDNPLTVSTSFAVVGADGQVRPGSLGAQVATSEALSVRLELSREARVSVVRLGERGPEIVLENELMPAGRRDLRRAGQLLGIPLAGLAGDEQFRVVASERALNPAEIEAVGRGQVLPGATAGGFSVHVGP